MSAKADYDMISIFFPDNKCLLTNIIAFCALNFLLLTTGYHFDCKFYRSVSF